MSDKLLNAVRELTQVDAQRLREIAEYLGDDATMELSVMEMADFLRALADRAEMDEAARIGNAVLARELPAVSDRAEAELLELAADREALFKFVNELRIAFGIEAKDGAAKELYDAIRTLLSERDALFVSSRSVSYCCCQANMVKTIPSGKIMSEAESQREGCATCGGSGCIARNEEGKPSTDECPDCVDKAPVAWREMDGGEWVYYDADSEVGEHIALYQKRRHGTSVFPLYTAPQSLPDSALVRAIKECPVVVPYLDRDEDAVAEVPNALIGCEVALVRLDRIEQRAREIAQQSKGE